MNDSQTSAESQALWHPRAVDLNPSSAGFGRGYGCSSSNTLFQSASEPSSRRFPTSFLLSIPCLSYFHSAHSQGPTSLEGPCPDHHQAAAPSPTGTEQTQLQQEHSLPCTTWQLPAPNPTVPSFQTFQQHRFSVILLRGSCKP